MLLSINPEHVDKILAGDKKFEYRKVRCRSDVKKIVIYVTYPTMQVVGEVDVLDIIEDAPDKVWEKTFEYAGITRQYYEKYYKGKKKAIAYKLGNIEKYKIPIPLSELGINSAPQSFIYL
jgi:Uncharacterized conserved protein